MAQRLNLEIHKDGKVLANAYYHWSGYTRSAIALTRKVLGQVDKIQEESDIVYAFRLLETTGAGFTDDEMPYAKNLAPDKHFQKAIDRNEGYIAISEQGINETRFWEDSRVEVDLTNRMVHFYVFTKYPKDEFIKDYGQEEYDQLRNFSFGTSIPFDKFDDFAQMIEKLIKDGIYNVKYNDDVICFHE